MRTIRIVYRICVTLLVLGLGIGCVLDILGNPAGEEVLAKLGYPLYIIPFLAVAKLLALAVIALPVTPRLKEWAFAGLTFDVTGALFSIVASGFGIQGTIIPVIALVLLFIAYTLYHKLRKAQMVNGFA